MKKQTPCYQCHRFPSEIISDAVWLYYRLLRTQAFQVWQDVVRA